MKANYRSWVQLMIAIIAPLFGLTLVGLALFMPPRGVIDPTVLTAYGETLTFVGALIGIDYHYRERPPKRSSEIKEQRAEPYFSTDYALLNNEQALLFFILDNEKFCKILRNRPKAVVHKNKTNLSILFFIYHGKDY